MARIQKSQIHNMKIQIEEIQRPNGKFYAAYFVRRDLLFCKKYIPIGEWEKRHDGTTDWYSPDDVSTWSLKAHEHPTAADAIEYARQYCLWLAEEGFKKVLCREIKTGRVEGEPGKI